LFIKVALLLFEFRLVSNSSCLYILKTKLSFDSRLASVVCGRAVAHGIDGELINCVLSLILHVSVQFVYCWFADGFQRIWPCGFIR